MAGGFKHSVLTEFLKNTGILNNISRGDFGSEEEYERCKHDMIEGSKIILMENGSDLEKSIDYLSKDVKIPKFRP